MEPGRHVLIVDDDASFLAAMAAALRQAGYRVTTAEHFSTALNALDDRDNAPDMLVTDVVMPSSINGIALGRMAHMRYRDMPVVYVTGFDLPVNDQAGLGPLLRKPIAAEQLIEAIEAEFSKRDE